MKREREGEGEGQRDRESEEKTCHPVLASSLTNFRAFPFHSDCNATIELRSPARLPVPRLPTRACSARVGCARGLRACATSEREREREVAAEEVITPAAATPGRSIAGRKVAGLCVCD